MWCLTWKRCVKLIVGFMLIEIVIMLLSHMKLHDWYGNTDGGLGVERLNGYRDDETAESFLRLYQSYCTERLYPKISNVPHRFITAGYSNDTLCACLPDTIGQFCCRSSRCCSSSCSSISSSCCPTYHSSL